MRFVSETKSTAFLLVTADGKLCQILAAAIENARSPNVDRRV